MSRVLSLPCVAAVLITCSAWCGAGLASAQTPPELYICTYDNSAGGPSLDGYVTSRFYLSFDGQYSGSQLLIGLNTGHFYRDALGSPVGVAPNPLFFPTFPSLEFDTYVVGSPGGGAVDLGGAPAAEFPSAGGTTLNQAWNPVPGDDIIDQEYYLTAQVTLSDDASGTWSYLYSVDGQITATSQFSLIDGSFFLSQPPCDIPEPSSLVLLGLAGTGMLCRRRVA